MFHYTFEEYTPERDRSKRAEFEKKWDKSNLSKFSQIALILNNFDICSAKSSDLLPGDEEVILTKCRSLVRFLYTSYKSRKIIYRGTVSGCVSKKCLDIPSCKVTKNHQFAVITGKGLDRFSILPFTESLNYLYVCTKPTTWLSTDAFSGVPRQKRTIPQGTGLGRLIRPR